MTFGLGFRIGIDRAQKLSMHDGINLALISLTYTRVAIEQVAQAVLELGQGTQLAKIDIKVPFESSTPIWMIVLC